MTRQTVLIIKHGFSETCDKSVSSVVSYGDVFRCTCLLEDFRGCHVTWITSAAVRDLLAGNHLIDRLIFADSPAELDPADILSRYDEVINLEKQRDWCEFAAGLEAGIHYGFRDWTDTGEESFYPASAAALSSGLERSEYRPLQETLFETVGRQWFGQRYVLGRRPTVAQLYDIGLNHNVGPKWPTKTWPKSSWQELHDRLSSDYAVSWQQSLNSVRHYMDWLGSCRLIVTSDSLGLHLALALQKKTVALFGPTPPEQVYMYGCGVKLTPVCDRDCVPCFQPKCGFGENCMEYISVDMVVEAVQTLLTGETTLAPARQNDADAELATVGG